MSLRRNKPMRRVSPTNKRWNAPGRARPDEPLADWCGLALPGVCTGRATDRHHIIPRGPGSSDEAWNTIDVDQACHQAIHQRPAWAREQGYLKHRPPYVPGWYPVLCVAIVTAVSAGLLALGGCSDEPVCTEPGYADCPSDAGGEAGE